MQPQGSAAGREAGRRPARLRPWETVVPTVAAVVVAVAAVVTAVMVKRGELNLGKQPQTVLQPVREPEASSPAALAQAPPSASRESAATGPGGLVKAPPLQPVPSITGAGGAASAVRNTADPPCNRCGVVATVVAVYGRDKSKPSAYQMHIRMDDGTMRTVEQRGALAAGTRVVVQGASLRPVAPGGTS